MPRKIVPTPDKVKVTPQQAMLAYLAIDKRYRSVNKAHKALLDQGDLIVPSLATLKNWSRHDSWKDVAIEHDYKMGLAISDLLVEAKAADYAEMAKNLYQVGGLALNRMANVLTQETNRGFDELQVDAGIALSMIHAAAVLEGRIDNGRGGGLGEPAELLPGKDDGQDETQAKMDNALRAFQQITSGHGAQKHGNGSGNGSGH